MVLRLAQQPLVATHPSAFLTHPSAFIADTDEACAVLCNEDPKCEFFSWCPTNVTSG